MLIKLHQGQKTRSSDVSEIYELIGKQIKFLKI